MIGAKQPPSGMASAEMIKCLVVETHGSARWRTAASRAALEHTRYQAPPRPVRRTAAQRLQTVSAGAARGHWRLASAAEQLLEPAEESTALAGRGGLRCRTACRRLGSRCWPGGGWRLTGRRSGLRCRRSADRPHVHPACLLHLLVVATQDGIPPAPEELPTASARDVCAERNPSVRPVPISVTRGHVSCRSLPAHSTGSLSASAHDDGAEWNLSVQCS